MIALAAVLLVVGLSLLVTRVASVALALTGLSGESARFQARSAFFGVGFTTAESEAVTGHPVRRRIVLALMLLGPAGVIGVVASAVVSFAGVGTADGAQRGGVLLAGLVALALLSRSHRLGRLLERAIAAVLRRYTDLEGRSHARLLNLAGDHGVSELAVETGGWLAGRSLAELALDEEGIVVLGISRRGGGYEGDPRPGDVLHSGDGLVLYGRGDAVAELDRRAVGAGGDRAHDDAVAEHRRRTDGADPDLAPRF